MPEGPEVSVVDDILTGLALAVQRHDDISADPRYVTKTKLEKLVYMAADEFDCPYTYSWYLAGVKARSSSSFKPSYQTTAQTVTPDVNESFADDSIPYSPTEREEEYAEFFDEYVHWLVKSKYEFLEDFYSSEAPDEYQELYLSVHSVRTLLDETVNELDSSDSTLQTGLSSFEEEQPSVNVRYEDIGRKISRIHLELSADSDLRKAMPQYKRYTDLLERALFGLSNMNAADVGDEQIRCISKLDEFHYHNAWKLPALVISLNTARGPRCDEIIADRSQKLDNFEPRYSRGLEDLAEDCRAAGLLDGDVKYPEPDNSQSMELIAELTNRYLSN
ncbi:hypothetical protein [Haloferax denitrificans]|uniref:DUF8098 domain-containing protein n=1 Tax=Haloferax denitrificans ATCC 35960 TaxID=662478 RepID=M0JCT0_9EURY|nr:hypothetical protein [Haloferax denitrificans]EMA06927.1 hypothetical protein C438_05222 [Haloferax denitrificans ATCC 35960]